MLDRLVSLFLPKAEAHREQKFWEWFTANEARYRTLQAGAPEQDALFNELTRRLYRVQKGLQFAFDTPNGEDPSAAPREFVLSADGNRALFPAVQRLAAAAPPPEALPGWKVVAFRPRMRSLDGVALQFGEMRVGADDLWLHLRPRGDTIDIDLYLRGLTEGTDRQIQMACLLLLDYALGEYDVETKVGALDIHPLPDDPSAAGLTPYPRLPEEFDARFALLHDTR